MTEEALGVAEATAEPIVDSGEAPEVVAPSQGTEEAIRRAFDAVDKGEAGGATEASQDGDASARDRDEAGRFKAKSEEQPVKAEESPKPSLADQSDTPSRFSADAKAEWGNTPAPVKAEIKRAFSELEGGIERYRQEVEPIREFMELAKSNGGTLQGALQQYVGIENTLRTDPVAGLEQICRNLGTTLAEVAGKASEAPADQAQQQHVRNLEAKVSQLSAQLEGVSHNVQSQQVSQVQAQIADFAADPAHARFDELSEPITQLLQTGMAADLSQAYQMADRLNPAPSPTPALAPTAQPKPAAHTGRAKLSVQGAPSSGSNPAAASRSATTQEAIERAFAAVGS